MMDRDRHLRNYGLHSWSGIVLGLFVYVVCFTGCFALFHHEILSWEDPSRRLALAEEPVKMNDRFTDWLAETSDGRDVSFARFTFPNAVEPYFVGGMGYEDEDGKFQFKEQRWDPKTGGVLPERGHGLSEWLLDFHRDLMWPASLGGATAGRTIVGIAGVILMLAILTGVIAHTKITKELFTLRWFRSVRLKWQDTHKVLGLWGLPFYAMIAITGAILGVVAILAPIVALLTFKGDQEALIHAVLGEDPEPAGISAPMISVDDLPQFRLDGNDNPIWFAVMHHWGDKNATYDLYFKPDTELLIVEAYQISGVTGERVTDSQFESGSVATRIVGAVTPLHYGTFGGDGAGGIALKILYFGLGLALAVITALGMMMWVERRLHGAVGARSISFYQRMSHVVTGACLGLPVATALIFVQEKVYFGDEERRLFWTGVTYFAAWGGAIGYALWRRQDYRTVRELLIASGALFVLAAVANNIAAPDGVSQLFSSGHKAAAYVDLGLFALGVATIALVLRLPVRRTDKAPTPLESVGRVSLGAEDGSVPAE